MAYESRDGATGDHDAGGARSVHENGVFVGEVEDLRLDLDVQQVTGLALHQVNTELFDPEVSASRGVIVPYRWVQAIGDIVIVNDVVERVRGDAEGDEEVAA